jgi:MerR family transcriptional regulator/heat shock protein HspR
MKTRDEADRMVANRVGARSGARTDPSRPVYVISVAADIVHVHPRTLRIYELEGLICPARTPTNIRLYSDNDIRRVLWIRYLTQNLGVNLAGARLLFELEERLGTRILETLITERPDREDADAPETDAEGIDAPVTVRRTRSASMER